MFVPGYPEGTRLEKENRIQNGTTWSGTETDTDQGLEPEALGSEARSRGKSWIVLDTPDKSAAWLAPAALDAGRRLSTSSDRRGRSRTIPASLRFEVLRRDGSVRRRRTTCGRHALTATWGRMRGGSELMTPLGVHRSARWGYIDSKRVP